MKFELTVQDTNELDPVLGPFRQVPEHHHEWELSVENECGHVSMSLVCTNPCSVPYCYHTGRLCSCVWVAEQDVDFYAESLPIRIDITPGYQDSYTREWEAPIVEGKPR